MASIKDWPKNDYSLETSLIFGLPEMLGIIDQKDVWVHVRLNNGTYIPINATYLFSYSSDLKGAEWPDIFHERTKEIVTLKNTNYRTSTFGVLYPIKEPSYLSGKFCVTFSGWKDDTLTWFYTEEKSFELKIY